MLAFQAQTVVTHDVMAYYWGDSGDALGEANEGLIGYIEACRSKPGGIVIVPWACKFSHELKLS